MSTWSKCFGGGAGLVPVGTFCAKLRVVKAQMKSALRARLWMRQSGLYPPKFHLPLVRQDYLWSAFRSVLMLTPDLAATPCTPKPSACNFLADLTSTWTALRPNCLPALLARCSPALVRSEIENALLLRQRGHKRQDRVLHDPTRIKEPLHERPPSHAPRIELLKINQRLPRAFTR